MTSKEFLTIVVRWLLLSVCGYLVAAGILPQHIADAIVSFTLSPLVGFIGLFGLLLWRIAKKRFDELEREKLYTANPATKTRQDIKLETWKENKSKFVLPI